MRQKLLTFFTLAAFAIAFGGFTFYVSIVVPIGTNILGSARAQGEITQQVTHWINAATAIAAGCMLVNTWSAWRRQPGDTHLRSDVRWVWVEWLAIGTIIAGLIGLLGLHPMLDDLIVGAPGKIQVRHRENFYQWHRAYLWISTLQWLASWIWLAAWVRRATKLG